MNTLTINGTALTDIYVDAALSFNKPAKRVETFAIPGRNGDLVIDEGVFENVLISYPVYEKATFPAEFDDIVNTLAGVSGYQRVECSNDATHYRLGRFVVPEAATAKVLNTDGYYELAFDCKPQRYLLSGENAQTFTASGTISNPTDWPSSPLIRVYGVGTVTVGSVAITLSTNATYTDIDSEMQDCYKGSDNLNANVSFSGNNFPTLAPGSNTVTLGAGITKVEITPRWWEL